MNRTEEIERRIATLEKELESLEGTPTEIYTRIVGYYRSLKNWNRGKREEYRHRRTFDVGLSLDNPPRREFEIIPKREQRSPGEAESRVDRILFFSRTHCPNCAPMRQALAKAGIHAEVIDVDGDEGFELARRFGILATPTLLMLSEAEEELRRITDPLLVSDADIA